MSVDHAAQDTLAGVWRMPMLRKDRLGKRARTGPHISHPVLCPGLLLTRLAGLLVSLLFACSMARGSTASGRYGDVILHSGHPGGGPRGALGFLPLRPRAHTAPQNHPVPLGLYPDPLRI